MRSGMTIWYRDTTRWQQDLLNRWLIHHGNCIPNS